MNTRPHQPDLAAPFGGLSPCGGGIESALGLVVVDSNRPAGGLAIAGALLMKRFGAPH